MLFKIVNHQIDINAEHLLIPNSDIHHTRGDNKRYTMPTTWLNCYKHSFFPSTIIILNFLPPHVIDMTEIEQFKHSLAGL